jgi:hypothetical protein
MEIVICWNGISVLLWQRYNNNNKKPEDLKKQDKKPVNNKRHSNHKKIEGNFKWQEKKYRKMHFKNFNSIFVASFL